MGVISVLARKEGGGVVGTLVKGDAGTTIVEITVNRFSEGVDLSSLRWSVAFRNAAGKEIVVEIKETTISDDAIRFVWVPDQIAAAAVGLTMFDIAGMDRNALVWNTATYTIEVLKNLGITRVVVDLTSAICGKAICGKAICGRR